MARLDRSSAAGVAYGSAAPAIEVRGLSFAIPGPEAPVLEGLDWRVSQGAFALLVGGTGSGKSTLLRTIAGLEPIQGGTISINDQVIDAGKPGTERAGTIRPVQ